MEVTVKGWKRVDYVSKKTGKNVKGYNIYYTRKPNVSEEAYITGTVCEDVYVSDNFDMSRLAVGFKYNITYNRFGGVEDIQELKM